MKEKIKEYFENHKHQLLGLIADLVEYPSVRGEAQEGRPFGEKPYEVLCRALEFADVFGFRTENHDGYVGTVDMGEGEPELGILAHLDVVPAGDGWSTDPYKMEVRGDRVFGRGVSDDKGPAVCALFAMKAVRDLGLPITKSCRLILGTDEECGSSDIAHYFQTAKPPKYVFTPDANFPVTNGEKGRFTKHFYKTVDFSGEAKTVASFNAGKAANAVPDYAEAVVSGVNVDEIAKAIELSGNTGAEFTADGGRIKCIGTAAHASLPENGNNPVTALFEMLSHIDFGEKTAEFISSLCRLFPHGKWNGEAFGVDMCDKLGALTLTLDVVNFDGKNFEGCFDTRTPMSATQENCADKIKAELKKYGFEIENTEMIKPHYVDENSEFVQTLLNAYETYSGDKGDCISMGGGTYVHDIASGVAFGAISRDTQTNMHGADEFMLIDDLLTAAEIFTQVIAEICR